MVINKGVNINGKKIIFISIFMFFLFCCFVWFLNSIDDVYLSGKDTEKSFGNGRYQIISFPKDENGIIKKALIDVKENEMIGSFVYHVKEIDNLVYIEGEMGYTLLDYDNESYQQFHTIQDFKQEAQVIFNQFQYEIKISF